MDMTPSLDDQTPPRPGGLDTNRSLRRWSIAGAAIGLLIALVLVCLGAAGGEAAEGVVCSTSVATLPSSLLFAAFRSPPTWWLFVVLAWCAQASALGLGGGAMVRSLGLRWLAGGLVLVVVELSVPLILIDSYRFFAG